MKVHTAYIPCRCCDGHGMVEVTGVYIDTLRELKQVGHEITAADLARRMGVKATAMSNRLAWLLERLLVTARPYGRKVFYQAT